MTPPKIIVNLSNSITNIAERVLIFYPTPKSTRLIINIVYIVTLFAACMAILSYDYVSPSLSNSTLNTTSPTITTINNFSVPIITQSSQTEVITQPHPLVENKYIRLVVGIIGFYLAISFLYSNTLHSQLKNWDAQNS